MIDLSVNGVNNLEEAIRSLVSEYGMKDKEWIPGEDYVQYAGSYVTEEESIAAISSLLTGWFGLGEKGIRFERHFRSHLGKDHGVLTNSGSSANLLMLSALKSKNAYGFPEGTKIITPVAGFPTTVNPILQCGFEPVFVDIELDTLNLNVEQVERAAKDGAKALVFAHVLGNPPNMNEIMRIVEEYDLVLLEDCCDALGSKYQDRLLGSYGDMSSCSFYPAHHITMGEGGFVGCKTKELDTVVRSLREWGRGCYCSGKASTCLIDGMCGKRYSNWLPSLPKEVFDHKYVYNEIGYNLKPMDLQAAIGLVQLKKLDEIISKRKDNFNRLIEIFEPYESVFHLPKATEGSDPSWFAFPLTVRDGIYTERNSFTRFLEEHKIQTRNYFGGNLMLQPAYEGIYDGDPIEDFPVATKVTKDTFFLGTSPVITPEQMDYINGVVKKYFDIASRGA